MPSKWQPYLDDEYAPIMNDQYMLWTVSDAALHNNGQTSLQCQFVKQLGACM